MYAIYKNNIYYIFCQGTQKLLGTHLKEKKLENFEQSSDDYIRDMSEVLNEIESMFDIKFYVTYVNKSKTRTRGQIRWQVSEYAPLHRAFDIEKDEVGIYLNGISRSSDWVQDDKCFCSKIVDIRDCSEFTVVREYKRKDGVDYEKPLIEEDVVTAEEFKKIMVSYRKQNI